MRYTEPKARSAELLRLALAHMGRHDAAFNPVTFTLWYEHVAGVNAKLSAEIERLVAEGAKLDDDAVAQLYRAYITPADDMTLARIGSDMQRLMSSVAYSASQAGLRAGAFGEQLSGLSEALNAPGDEQLKPRLTELLAGTAAMQDAVRSLQHKVSASQQEIERLRGDLDRARDEALLDALTGVLNRKGFDRRLAALLEEKPTAGRVHCLVMLDIDHFKKVNDTHGHIFGDRVIQAVGEILRASVTQAGHAAARYGGEEFAILMPQSTLEQAWQVAEDVRLRIQALKIRDRRTKDVVLTVSISGGVAALQPGDDASAFVQRADAALYQSKNAGRDRVTRG